MNNIYKYLSVGLIGVALTLILGWVFRGCSPQNIIPSIGSNGSLDQIVIEKKVTDTIYFPRMIAVTKWKLKTVEVHDTVILKPDIEYSNPDSLPAVELVDMIFSDLDTLDSWGVSIRFSDTLYTTYQDTIIPRFNLTKRQFEEAQVMLSPRQIEYIEKMVIVPKSEPWWVKAAIGVGAFAGGYFIGASK